MFWAPTGLVYLSLWLCTTAYTASLVDSGWLHSIPAAVPCGQLTVLELPICLCLRLKLDYMSTNRPFWPFSVIPTLSHGATTLSHGAKPQPLSMTPPWLHKSKYNVGNFYIVPSSSARLRHLWSTASVFTLFQSKYLPEDFNSVMLVFFRTADFSTPDNKHHFPE